MKDISIYLLEHNRKPGTKREYVNNIIIGSEGEFINKNNIDILAL